MTPYSRLSFEGQAVLAVGAAQGIGRAAAELLAARGAKVICADQDADGCRQAAEKISAAGGHADWAPLDVTDPASVHAAVAAVLERHSRFHAVLNCAGITGHT